jgi:hypothetical protein
MYIDPNAGGMLFQILAVLFGLFSGVILVFSGRIRRVIGKWRRKAREKANPESNENTSEDVPPASS